MQAVPISECVMASVLLVCCAFSIIRECWYATILVLYNINYRKPITILKYIQTGNLYVTKHIIFQCDSENVDIIDVQYASVSTQMYM